MRSKVVVETKGGINAGGSSGIGQSGDMLKARWDDVHFSVLYELVVVIWILLRHGQ